MYIENRRVRNTLNLIALVVYAAAVTYAVLEALR